MKFVETTALHKLVAMSARIKGVRGGTSASKTISIEQILIEKAQMDTEPTLTSIMSESVPHLKRGAIRDFKNILMSTGYWEDSCWNSTDATYTFPLFDPISKKLVSKHGSKIEFFSLDMPHKVRGPRRRRGFINEANNIPFETFEQIEVRTQDELWLDWNPVETFWFDEEVLPKRDDAELITLTYKDNEGLPAEIVRSIEQRMPKEGEQPSQWWVVYGMGQVGETEGRIYKGWQIIDELPHEARLERYGLDFGYSNDPTAIVAIYYYNGGYILDEITYQKELSNKQIADTLKSLPKALVMADSAEPKSIDEIRLYGVNIMPVTKGQGSIMQGIQYIQDQRMSITKRSVNGIKEYRNYMWITDKDGRIINTPVDMWNHFLDATRYGFDGLRATQERPKIYKPANMVNAKRRYR